ncbi:MAG TPA: acetylmuramidase, partial [Paracoccus sp.]|nr:acetylmuramidase [Paracoccus sp. (in: a-proteobacteria)]
MARENFAACMAEIFAHEGGYVDHPKDPGGATNMGITIGTLREWRGGPVTKDDVRSLTKREAETIYRARYWNPVRGDDLRAGVDLVALDPAVNSGVRRGVQWLQRAVGVTADGKMGPLTLKAANDATPVDAIKRACAVRMGFLRGLRTWDTFGRGWSRRVARVEAVAVRMAVEASTLPARPTLIAEKAEAEAKARREGTNAGGVAVGGGAGTTLADLPDWTVLVLAAVVVLAVINLLGRRRHEQERAAAFQAVAEEARA